MLWVKAFHIIAVVCWFAVLFYLPRLFVYHAMSEDDISKERFKVMERKLIRGIGTPSMVAVLILGLWLVGYAWPFYKTAPWFWAKIVLVIMLMGYYMTCIRIWKNFCNDNNTRSHIFYRWFNEVPVILLIAIVCLVVVKPQW